MSFSDILFIVFTVFAVLGGLDYILSNRFGIGKAFERGIVTMGPLALAMTGMIVLAPFLANILSPVVVPVFNWMYSLYHCMEIFIFMLHGTASDKVPLPISGVCCDNSTLHTPMVLLLYGAHRVSVGGKVPLPISGLCCVNSKLQTPIF